MSASIPIASTRSVTGIPSGKLAIWLVLASEIVIFGGLIMCYLLYRLLNDAWSADAAMTSTLAGGTNTFILLTSSLFAVLAHQAAEKKDGDKAFKYLWLTILGGLLFLCVKSYEYTTEISHGFVLTTNVFWSFYYTATGLHGIHVVAGMVAMAIVSFSAKQNHHLGRVELVALYWHFVDVVWIFLFPLLYIAK
jgi:heme/copper-type cytochrome/quinol oxidase subunit 3